MDFLLVANFKSNKSKDEVTSWLKEVEAQIGESRATVIVAPALPHLQLSESNAKLHLAAQDVSPFPPGSYTGAVAARELKDMGVEYCIIGHSERRRYFHETHTEIANKADLLLRAGITPILCLSHDDMTPQLAALEDNQKSKIYFCYEPPEDIGGSETAPVDEIAATLKKLQSLLGEDAKLMYGGSVNNGNIAHLLPLNLRGVIVATASLEAESFISVIKSFADGT